MSRLRLDRLLADMGAGTRSAVKEMIRRGRVTVNGTVERRPDAKVEPESDRVELDGRQIRYARYEYWMLNKPAGVVSATRDERERTVLSLLPEEARRDLFPVGRLDKDTEGLLLLTNDGELGHRLTSPARHEEKTYFARVSKRLTEADAEAFRRGIDIGDEKPAAPAGLEILRAGEESEALVTLTEGRYHQVKRMFAARGGQVLYLKRLSMGGLRLDESLAPGQARRLTKEELRLLLNA